MATKMNYEAPTVSFLKFDESDIMTASNWNFNCQSYGEGDNQMPPDCSASIHTDNSEN